MRHAWHQKQTDADFTTIASERIYYGRSCKVDLELLTFPHAVEIVTI